MRIEIASTIGKTIKQARESKKITQQDLSQQVGVSRNYISDIECGRYIPSVETLLSISSILKIDLNVLKNDGNTIYKEV